MPSPRSWRVMVKRGRKVHLTPFVPNQGSGTVALCKQPLPEESRTRGSAEAIAEPRGDECPACRIVSRHRERPKRPEMTATQRHYKNVLNMAKSLKELGLSPDEIRKIISPAAHKESV